MTIDRAALEERGRDDLVAEARRWGVKRPEVMTRVELVDEVLRLGTPNPVERKQVRGWLGVARDLIASVVEQGLNLPDAAALIRGDVRFEPLRAPQPPVATVTLAEIYGAQGHHDRALSILDEVLGKESDHDVARKLRDKLAAERAEKRSQAKRSEASDPPLPALEDEPAADAGAAPVEEEDEAETLVPAAPVEEAEPDTLIPAARVDELDAMTLRPPPGVILSKIAAIAAPPRLPEVPRPSSHEGAEPPTPRRPAQLERPSDVAALFTRTSAENLVAYFELGDRSLAREGGVVLRVVEMRPRGLGAERVQHDFGVSGERGTVDVSELEAGSVVRVALGSKSAGKFRALAVAAEVSLSADGVTVAWAPRRSVDYPAIASRFGHLLAGSLGD